jgi:hypothetical protein
MSDLSLTQILDRAIQSERGVALRTESRGKAINLAQKLGRFRRDERGQSRKVYPPDHPQHGKTPWDGLRIKVSEANPTEVVLDRFDADILEIKEL